MITTSTEPSDSIVEPPVESPYAFIRPTTIHFQFIEPLDEDLKRKPKFAAAVKVYEAADDYMRQLAERTGGRFYSAVKSERLAPVFTSIAEELRHQYSIGYYPANRPQPGERRVIKVRVNRQDVFVRARKNYLGCITPRSR